MTTLFAATSPLLVAVSLKTTTSPTLTTSSFERSLKMLTSGGNGVGGRISVSDDETLLSVLISSVEVVTRTVFLMISPTTASRGMSASIVITTEPSTGIVPRVHATAGVAAALRGRDRRVPDLGREGVVEQDVLSGVRAGVAHDKVPGDAGIGLGGCRSGLDDRNVSKRIDHGFRGRGIVVRSGIEFRAARRSRY